MGRFTADQKYREAMRTLNGLKRVSDENKIPPETAKRRIDLWTQIANDFLQQAEHDPSSTRKRQTRGGG
jgi:hypothetical protein